jgi:hypothetical protein
VRWPAALALSLGLAACGRAGFDARDPEPPPVPIPLACGDSRPIADLPAVPLGLGLAATDATAVAAWSGAVPAAGLDGLRLELAGDELTVVHAWSAALPEPIGAFSLAGGDARYVLRAQVAAGALAVPLDAALAAASAWTLQPGATIASHAVAEPIAAGGRFAAAGIENGAATFSLLDEAGAATGTVHRRSAAGEVSIHRGDRRHTVTWTAPGGGCAVWAFDAAFTPVLPDPLIHEPGGECLRAGITRHGSGINLLAWIDGGAVHAQLGTDTDTIGGKLVLAEDPEDLELAVSPTGFLVASATGAAIEISYVPTADDGFRTRPAVPHLPGTPIRMVSNRDGALLASVGTSASTPQLWLTRLCEP